MKKNEDLEGKLKNEIVSLVILFKFLKNNFMIPSEWKKELEIYLNEHFSIYEKEIIEKYGNNTAIFLEHNEFNKITVYYSKCFVIHEDGSYEPMGEKIEYTKIDITVYNNKIPDSKLKRYQIGYIINEIKIPFYSKWNLYLKNLKGNL